MKSNSEHLFSSVRFFIDSNLKDLLLKNYSSEEEMFNTLDSEEVEIEYRDLLVNVKGSYEIDTGAYGSFTSRVNTTFSVSFGDFIEAIGQIDSRIYNVVPKEEWDKSTDWLYTVKVIGKYFNNIINDEDIKTYIGDYFNDEAADNEFDTHEYFDESIKSYGGAFDIEDDQFFTREDLDDLADVVMGHINETFYDKYEYLSSYFIENKNIKFTIFDKDGTEFTSTTHIDMRRIRKPADLKEYYGLEIAADLIKQIKEYKDDNLNKDTDNIFNEFDHYKDLILNNKFHLVISGLDTKKYYLTTGIWSKNKPTYIDYATAENLIRELNLKIDPYYSNYMLKFYSLPGALYEDTIKTKSGKWVNKGEEGVHGEFRTKKQADAQRKAMFARGYKSESLEEKEAHNENTKRTKDDPWGLLS